jgi:hypothetical protein
MIRITSKRDNFRRCGVAHRAVPVEWPDDRFDAEQLARLKAELMLVVEIVPDLQSPEPVEGPAEEKPKGKKS